MNLLEEALGYHSLGWSIVPVKHETKLPSIREWECFQTVGPNEQQVRKWWSKGDKGIAVILGEVSDGLICRDFDRMEAYDAWATEYPELAAMLPTVATGRGRHVYCRADIPELVAQLGGAGVRKWDDGEFRVSRCYCVLPPSLHPNGTAYRWVTRPPKEIPHCDPFNAGLLQSWGSGDVTERIREYGEELRKQRTTEKTEAMESFIPEFNSSTTAPSSSPSVPSVTSKNSVTAEINKVIKATLPSGPGKRHRQVFELARGLKSISALRDAKLETLKPMVREWHRQAKRVIETQPFDETWIDFMNAWPNVRYPLGTEPMAMIFERACRSEPPPFAMEYEQEGLRKLVLLCRELQREHPSEPFFLPVRKAQELLKLPKPMTASRWMTLLRSDKVILEVEKGELGKRRASRYRYLKEL